MSVADIIGLAALIVALIGIPITFYLGKRSRQVPDLRYSTDFDVILDPSDRLFDRGLVMNLAGKPITCISRTRIAFWNERGDTVRGADIVDNDPLRIQFEEADNALQVRRLCTSREQTALAAAIDLVDQSSVRFSFDFLDAGDGAVFEIHQVAKEPQLLGTVRGSTIHNRGGASLGPPALEAVAEGSLWRRFRMYAPKSTRRQIIGQLVALVAGVLALVITIFLQRHLGHLVNSVHYNLKSAEGQKALLQQLTRRAILSTTIP